MRRLRALLLRWTSLFTRERRDYEFSDELESHLALHIEDNLRSGMNAEEARRQALIKLGGIEQTRERYREQSGLPLLETLLQDLRFGARMLRKNPGFAAIAVLTLALGIGANTAVFSVVDTVLLRPLPYRDPQQLVLVTESMPLQQGTEMGTAAAEYLDYRDRNRSFSQIAGYESDGFNLTGSGTPLRVNAALLTPSAFPLLGVSPILGRTFTDDEGRAGADHVVVLSYGLWQREYGGNPRVLGTNIKLDEKSYTVLGVMPASFQFPFDGNALGAAPSDRADLWVPLTFTPEQIQDRIAEFPVGLVGRLKPGISKAQAQEDLNSVAAGFMKQYPQFYSGNLLVTPHAVLYSARSVAKMRTLVLLLMTAVGCVLLIACANVANLLLARATHRAREMAIRGAIGATRARIFRQCLIESGLLAILGAGCGIGLALALIRALRHFGPADLPRLQDVTMHPLALWFTLGISLLTSVLFGVIPAWRLSQISPQACLRETTQGPARSSHRLQNRVAIGEIALALALLIGSSLLLKSFVRVLDVPFGFDPNGAVVVRTLFDRPRYPDPVKREAVQKELLGRLSQMPGVTAVAAASHLPLSDEREIGFQLEHAAANDFHWAQNSLVSPGYFHAMGISLIQGRDFKYEDNRQTPPVAIINETFARQYFPKGDAIGQRFNWGGRALFTIIGVAADVHISALDADPMPMIYDSMFQVESGASSRTAFILRVPQLNRSAQQEIVSAVRQQVWSVDKDLPVYNATTLETLVSESLARRRFTTLLMAEFAATALLLAAIGLFGVISYLVSERNRELAVRMALGADRRRILWMVLGRAASMALAGCGIGLALFAIGSRLLKGALYDTSALDPLTLLAAPLILIGIALLAAYWPARRAMRSDPMHALRYE